MKAIALVLLMLGVSSVAYALPDCHLTTNQKWCSNTNGCVWVGKCRARVASCVSVGATTQQQKINCNKAAANGKACAVVPVPGGYACR